MTRAKRNIAAKKGFPVTMPTRTRNERILGKMSDKPLSLAKQFMRHIHSLPQAGSHIKETSND